MEIKEGFRMPRALVEAYAYHVQQGRKPEAVAAWAEKMRPEQTGGQYTVRLQHLLVQLNHGRVPEAQPSLTCGRIWEKQCVAYRCLNCQLTPNSCICVECFKQGDHEGHDYRLYSSGYGGCCDCGDPLSWKPEGNCRHHGPSTLAQHPVTELLDLGASSELQHALPWLAEALRVLHARMLEVLVPCLAGESPADWQESTCGAGIEWLASLSTYGANLRMALCYCLSRAESALPDVPGSVLDYLRNAPTADLGESGASRTSVAMLETMILLCIKCSSSISSACTRALIQLLYEPAFKIEFSRVYVRLYGVYYAESAQGSRAHDMDVLLTTIGAQIFNVAEVVEDMVHESNLIGTALAYLHKLLRPLLRPRDLRPYPASSTRFDFQPVQDQTARVVGLLASVEEAGPSKKRTPASSAVERMEMVTEDEELAETGATRPKKTKVEESEPPSFWSNEVVDLDSAGLVDQTTRLSGDLDSAVKFRRLAQEMWGAGPDGELGRWLQMLAWMSGMNAHLHKKGEAETFDSDTWRAAFFMDMRTHSAMGSLRKGLRAYLLSNAVGVREWSSVLQPVVHAALRQAQLHSYTWHAVQWRCALPGPLDPCLGMVVIPRFDVQSQRVSLHWPLLHFLMELIREAAVGSEPSPKRPFPRWSLLFPSSTTTTTTTTTTTPTTPRTRSQGSHCSKDLWNKGVLENQNEEDHETGVEEKKESSMDVQRQDEDPHPAGSLSSILFAGISTDEAAQAALSAAFREGPMQTRVVLGQVGQGQWKRNGDHMQHQLHFYHSPYIFCSAADAHMLSMQVSAALQPTDAFVLAAVDRFQTVEAYGLGHSPAESHAPVEDLQHWLLMVLGNRVMVGYDDRMRYLLLHWLAAGDAGFSDLSKRMQFGDSRDRMKKMDEVLAEIADFLPPTQGRPGRYRLRRALWNEFDPGFPHYLRLHLSRVSEHYHMVHRTDDASPSSSASHVHSSMLPMGRLKPIRPMFANLLRLLDSAALASLVYTTLWNVVAQIPQSDRMLDGAIHLLTYLVDRVEDLRALQRNAERLEAEHWPRLPCSPAWAGFRAEHASQLVFRPSPDRPRVLGYLADRVSTWRGEFSMVDLMARLVARPDLSDRRVALSGLLARLGRLQPAQLEEDGLRVVDEDERKREAKARQLRMMERMRAQQARFSAAVGGSEPAEESADVLAGAGDVDERTVEVEYPNRPFLECVLCREVRPWQTHPMAVVCAADRSRILATASAHSNQDSMPSTANAKSSKEDSSSKEERPSVHSDSSARPPSPPPSSPSSTTSSSSSESTQESTRGRASSTNSLSLSSSSSSSSSEESSTMEGLEEVDVEEDEDYRALEQNIRQARSSPLVESWTEPGTNVTRLLFNLLGSHALGPMRGDTSRQWLRLRRAGREELEARGPPLRRMLSADPESGHGLVLRSCGHTAHVSCLEAYLNDRGAVAYGEHLDEALREFHCPQCRRVSNLAVPLVPVLRSSADLAVDSHPLRRSVSYSDAALDDSLLLPHGAAAGLSNSADPYRNAYGSRLDEMVAQRSSIEVPPSASSSSSPSISTANTSRSMDSSTIRLNGLNRNPKPNPTTTGNDNKVDSARPPHGLFHHVGPVELERLNAPQIRTAQMLADVANQLLLVLQGRSSVPSVLLPSEQWMELCNAVAYSTAALEYQSRRQPSGAVPAAAMDTASPFLAYVAESRCQQRLRVLKDLRAVLRALAPYVHAVSPSATSLAACARWMDAMMLGDLDAWVAGAQDPPDRWTPRSRLMCADDAFLGPPPPLLTQDLFAALVRWVFLTQMLHAPILTPSATHGSLNPPLSSSPPPPVPAAEPQETEEEGGEGAEYEVLRPLLAAEDEAEAGTEAGMEALAIEDSGDAQKEDVWSFLFQMQHVYRAAVVQAIVSVLVHPSEVRIPRDDSSSASSQPSLPPMDVWTAEAHFAGTPVQSMGGLVSLVAQILQQQRPGWVLAAARNRPEDAYASFEPAIQRRLLPFLRRAVLIRHVAVSSAPTYDDAHSLRRSSSTVGPMSEFDLLVRLLGLPTLRELCRHLAATEQVLVVRWVLALVGGPAPPQTPRKLSVPRPFAPFPLPHAFFDLFHRYYQRPCKRCRTVPRYPALCLVCGDYVCATVRGDCCKVDGLGEAYRHALACGAGSGLFLLTRHSVVMIIHGDRLLMWGSPYYDSHGEEDSALERGNPLFLVDSVYEHIIQAYLSHDLDSLIFRNGETRSIQESRHY